MTPTERTLAHYRHRGYRIERVERWVPVGRGGYRKDLLGLIDLLAIRRGEPVLAVQSCGRAWSAHLRTIAENEEVLGMWLSTGCGFELIGWRKLQSGWSPRIQAFTLSPLGSPLPPPFSLLKKPKAEKVFRPAPLVEPEQGDYI